MNQEQIVEFLRGVDSPYAGHIFFSLLLSMKIYYRFFKNSKLHGNRILKIKKCPFCNKPTYIKNGSCSKCNIKIDRNKERIICLNCGFLGEMRKYRSEMEFLLTAVMLAMLGFVPGVIYFFLNQNKQICPNCGRMKRKQDYIGVSEYME